MDLFLFRHPEMDYEKLACLTDYWSAVFSYTTRTAVSSLSLPQPCAFACSLATAASWLGQVEQRSLAFGGMKMRTRLKVSQRHLGGSILNLAMGWRRERKRREKGGVA